MKAENLLLSKFGNQFSDYVGEDQMWILDNILEAMKEYAEIRCKETARNVRHKAASILCTAFSEEDLVLDAVDRARQEIMNIKFDDIKPEL